MAWKRSGGASPPKLQSGFSLPVTLDEAQCRIENDKALVRAMNGVMKDDTELFNQFSDDPMFRRRLAELVFEQTYGQQLERERAGGA
jgi:hypothetical protein